MHVTSLQADWEPVTPLPQPNGGFMAGCVGGKIIIAGGTNWKNDTKQWLDEVHAFDPATNQWTAGGKLPHPLAYAACASDGSKMYFAGGADGTRGRKEVYALDAQMNLTKLGDLPEPVVFAGGAFRAGKLCILGGTPDPDDWSKATADLRELDLGSMKLQSHAPLKALGHGLGIPGVALSGDRLFAFTGAFLNPATKEVGNIAEAFAFDFKSGAWRALKPFYKPVRGLNETELDDRHFYLAGGYGTDAEEFLGEAFIYEVETDQYRPAKPMPFKSLSSLVKCGGFVYALGGEDKKKHRTDQCWRIKVDELLAK
jgi:N-acetylneuraminic acid mutarotase